MKAKTPRRHSAGEILFHKHMNELGLVLLPEYKFCEERKWRFDFVLARHPTLKKVAFEIDGGSWSGGRHTRGAGFQRDCDKGNCAIANDWKVFHFTTDDVMAGRAKDFVRQWLDRMQA